MFCVKQNTAYEMRISDWSSDVCSSDLVQQLGWHGEAVDAHRLQVPAGRAGVVLLQPDQQGAVAMGGDGGARQDGRLARAHHVLERGAVLLDAGTRLVLADEGAEHQTRSEEHTSELQSLMRISYA